MIFTWPLAPEWRMAKPYHALGKPLATRTLELLQGMQLVRDAIQKVREGHAHYLLVLSGQLRALLTERGKGETPLLLDMARVFGKELTVFWTPRLDDPAMPEFMKTGMTLHVAGLPVSIRRTLPRQQQSTLGEFIDEDVIAFHGRRYSPRSVIEWYANKAGGAHYSRKIPQDFAALLQFSPEITANLLLQIGEATVAVGRQFLKDIVDVEIHVLIAVAPQQTTLGNGHHYLLDLQYEGSNMRLSLILDAQLQPRFFARGLQGSGLQIGSDRVIEWSEPRYICATLAIEDDLSTVLEMVVDGTRVGKMRVAVPLFVFSDPVDYVMCINRACDGAPQAFSFGMGEMVMIGRELSAEERANMFLYLSEKRKSPELHLDKFAPQSFGRSEKGTTDVTMSGDVRSVLVGDLLP